MKGSRLFFSLLLFLLCLNACSGGNDSVAEKEVKLYPVETLRAPIGDDLIVLTIGSNLSFSWEAPMVEGEARISNVLKFDNEDGDFSSPLRTLTTNKNSIDVSHVTIDNLAGLAGIAVAETGTMKWTVSVAHGKEEIKSAVSSKITVKRLAKPKDEIPSQVYIYGEGSEVGMALSEALKFRSKSKGVFELFTRIEANKPFRFVNTKDDGDDVEYYYVDGHTIKTEEQENELNKSAVYRITLDFKTKKATFSEVSAFSLYFCIKNREILLDYKGKGLWEANYLVNFPQEWWGDEKRYKFRMVESNDGAKFWETAVGGSSEMREVRITSLNDQLWDGVWVFSDICKDRWNNITVDMSGESYIHAVTPFDSDLDNTRFAWTELADKSSSAFIDGFWNASRSHFNNNTTGTINPYDYWPEAHAIDVVIDAYVRSGNSKYKQVIYDFYEGVRRKNGNSFKNSFYDDMAWHGLAHLRAFEATNDTRYEQSAADLWGWILNGWDDKNGGVKWNDTPEGAEAGVPSTGPSTIIAVRRWVKYGDKEIKGGFNNLEWAKKMYDWMRTHRHDPATGGVYDDFDNKAGAWTYNTGTFLGAAMELYHVTKENGYLEDAIRTADWTLENLSVKAENSRILSDWAEQPDHDVNLFKGIFIRYFTQLIMYPDLPSEKRTHYISFLLYNAKALWRYASTQQGQLILYNYGWYFKPDEAYLRAQISGCMLMEAIALLEKEGFL